MDSAKHFTMHRMTKNYPAPNAHMLILRISASAPVPQGAVLQAQPFALTVLLYHFCGSRTLLQGHGFVPNILDCAP